MFEKEPVPVSEAFFSSSDRDYQHYQDLKNFNDHLLKMNDILLGQLLGSAQRDQVLLSAVLTRSVSEIMGDVNVADKIGVKK